MKEIPVVQLTNEQARQWLIANDGEGEDYWRMAEGDDFVDAVMENLLDYGYENQTGDIMIEDSTHKLNFVSLRRG